MKKFLTRSNNIQRDATVWNMAASVLNSFQSVLCLMVLSRAADTAEAGLYTIAFAYSNMFLMIGKYGMRHFQVSDGKREYSFREYRLSRVITCIAMMAAAVIFFLISAAAGAGAAMAGAVPASGEAAGTAASAGLFSRRTGILIWMCILRLPDAIEDIYYGMYQQNGRLDVGAKAMTVRMLIQILLYIILVGLTRDQYLALVITAAVNFLVLFWMLQDTAWLFCGSSAGESSDSGRDESVHPVKKENDPHSGEKRIGEQRDNEDKLREEWKSTWRLLASCFPLFLGSFLTIYITNAPKYAIDAILTDEEQAYYGYISMPVSMIGLLAGFIFIPLIYHYTQMWNGGKIRAFRIQLAKMSGMIAVITAVCIVLAAWVGIPVLSLLFHADLAAYRGDLLILLAGGGFSALAALLNAMVTVMRDQKRLLVGYLGTALAALLTSKSAVRAAGVHGASVLFLVLMVLQCVCFYAVFRAECRTAGKQIA